MIDDMFFSSFLVFHVWLYTLGLCLGTTLRHYRWLGRDWEKEEKHFWTNRKIWDVAAVTKLHLLLFYCVSSELKPKQSAHFPPLRGNLSSILGNITKWIIAPAPMEKILFKPLSFYRMQQLTQWWESQCHQSQLR